LSGRVGATSGKQQCREDDVPTNGSHGEVEVVWLGKDVSVGVDAFVFVGTGVEVTTNVDVGVEKSTVTVKVLVDVAGRGVFVIVTAGVLVGTFGTQSVWPTLMFVDEPIQFADCNCATVVRYNREMRYKLSPAFTA
jgi:hypothetical protein